MFKTFALSAIAAVAAADIDGDIEFNVRFAQNGASTQAAAATETMATSDAAATESKTGCTACQGNTLAQQFVAQGVKNEPYTEDEPVLEVLPVCKKATLDTNQRGFFMSPETEHDDGSSDNMARNPGLIEDWECTTEECGNIDCSGAIASYLDVLDKVIDDRVQFEVSLYKLLAVAFIRLGRDDITDFREDEIEAPYATAIADSTSIWFTDTFEFVKNTYELPTVEQKCLTETDALAELIEQQDELAGEKDRELQFVKEAISQLQLPQLQAIKNTLSDAADACQAEVDKLLKDKLETSGWDIDQDAFDLKTREYFDKYIYYDKIQLKPKREVGDLTLIVPDALSSFDLEMTVEAINSLIKKIQDCETY